MSPPFSFGLTSLAGSAIAVFFLIQRKNGYYSAIKLLYCLNKLYISGKYCSNINILKVGCEEMFLNSLIKILKILPACFPVSMIKIKCCVVDMRISPWRIKEGLSRNLCASRLYFPAQASEHEACIIWHCSLSICI